LLTPLRSILCLQLLIIQRFCSCSSANSMIPKRSQGEGYIPTAHLRTPRGLEPSQRKLAELCSELCSAGTGEAPVPTRASSQEHSKDEHAHAGEEIPLPRLAPKTDAKPGHHCKLLVTLHSVHSTCISHPSK